MQECFMRNTAYQKKKKCYPRFCEKFYLVFLPLGHMRFWDKPETRPHEESSTTTRMWNVTHHSISIFYIRVAFPNQMGSGTQEVCAWDCVFKCRRCDFCFGVRDIVCTALMPHECVHFLPCSVFDLKPCDEEKNPFEDSSAKPPWRPSASWAT